VSLITKNIKPEDRHTIEVTIAVLKRYRIHERLIVSLRDILDRADTEPAEPEATRNEAWK